MDAQSIEGAVDVANLLLQIVFIGVLRPLTNHIVNCWADILPLEVIRAAQFALKQLLHSTLCVRYEGCPYFKLQRIKSIVFYGHGLMSRSQLGRLHT